MNPNNEYFNGYYKDIWRQINPPKLTSKEVEFLMQHFQLDKNSRVLDLMCGFGRHAISLAEHGIHVTCVDNLPAYIGDVVEIATTNNLPIDARCEEVLYFTDQQKYNLCMFMGNSLNFFPEGELLTILEKCHTILQPSGHLLINTWSISEIAIPQFRAKDWSAVGEILFITESTFKLQPTRIESKHRILDNGKVVEEKLAVDYIFSFQELSVILKKVGFDIQEAYSIPGKKQYSFGDSQLYLVCQKITEN